MMKDDHVIVMLITCFWETKTEVAEEGVVGYNSPVLSFITLLAFWQYSHVKLGPLELALCQEKILFSFLLAHKTRELLKLFEKN